MSQTALPIVNGQVSHDFRSSDGYTNGIGLSQKQVGANWVLFAGNADQSLPTGYEITGPDNILWTSSNGLFDVYRAEDFNLDGDISGADKVFWSFNNGIFSIIPK